MTKIGGIIVEGADQMGKSTFIDLLYHKMVKVCDVNKLHFSKNTTDKSEVEYYTEFLNDNTPHLVDRNYLSEIIYGNYYRGKSKIDNNTKNIIEQKIKDNSYFMVIINRTSYEWEERPEEYDKLGNESIIKKYIEYAKSNLLNIDMIFINQDNPTQAVDLVFNYWLEKNNL